MAKFEDRAAGLLHKTRDFVHMYNEMEGFMDTESQIQIFEASIVFLIVVVSALLLVFSVMDLFRNEEGGKPLFLRFITLKEYKLYHLLLLLVYIPFWIWESALIGIYWLVKGFIKGVVTMGTVTVFRKKEN